MVMNKTLSVGCYYQLDLIQSMTQFDETMNIV